MGKYFFAGEIQFVWCFYSIFGSKSVITTKDISNNNCRILLLQGEVDDEIYVLVDLYNSNTKPEQLEALHEFETILLKFDAN